MADYHSLLMRAVANLPNAGTPATRASDLWPRSQGAARTAQKLASAAAGKRHHARGEGARRGDRRDRGDDTGRRTRLRPRFVVPDADLACSRKAGRALRRRPRPPRRPRPRNSPLSSAPLRRPRLGQSPPRRDRLRKRERRTNPDRQTRPFRQSLRSDRRRPRRGGASQPGARRKRQPRLRGSQPRQRRRRLRLPRLGPSWLLRWAIRLPSD